MNRRSYGAGFRIIPDIPIDHPYGFNQLLINDQQKEKL